MKFKLYGSGKHAKMAGSEWPSLPVSRNIIINQQYGADTIIHARERDKKQQEK